MTTGTRTAGRWITRGDPALVERLMARVEERAEAGSRLGGWIELEGRHVYRKGGPLTGKASTRHALRRAFLASPPPRLAEFDNLAWLRENGFHAAEPLFAAALMRRGRPRYQLLDTARVEGAIDLRVLLEGEDRQARAAALPALAEALGRLHARGFIHRDLFPRNLLWRASDATLHFIDAWRGGPRRGLRGPTYDLACWMLFGVELLSPVEIAAFFEVYRAARESAGKPLRGNWQRSVQRHRRHLVKRLERQRARGSSLPAARA